MSPAGEIRGTGSASVLAGNPGDVRPVGEGVSEIAGGDKRTQNDDIGMARRLARNL